MVHVAKQEITCNDLLMKSFEAFEPKLPKELVLVMLYRAPPD